jgi:hypothetical protein
MKLSAPILFALVLLVASGAAFATPITKEMGDQYYENCLKGAENEGTMSPKSQATFCKCTSGKMQDNMTIEDIQALSAKGDPARAALNKVLEFVQAPCLQAPVHDMIAQKCQTEIGKPQVCNCLSQKMAEYTEQQAVHLMGKILKQNPNIVDPMAAIVDSEDFQTTQQSIALSCLTNTQ